MSNGNNSLLVAACGNLMASDDAFGPMVARDLKQLHCPGIVVAELDIRPAALLDYLPGHSGLILVDAVFAPDEKPGLILDIDWFSHDRPDLVNDDTMSTHGLSLASQIQMAEKLGILPPIVRLIGLTIGSSPSVGQPQSPSLVRSVVHAADLIRMHASCYGEASTEAAYA